MHVATFINNDYREFAIYDCVRSIPSIFDGLKLSQRKALYGVIDLNQKAKVSTATSHAVKVSGYLHGETSMEDAIVKMSQTFPGSNNLPIFKGHGQFGSRLSNVSAASRYIFVELNKDIWNLMSKDDDLILKHQFEEGMFVEPKSYYPYVPFCLVNGAEGIGVGFATDIPPYSIPSLKKAVREIITHGKVKTPLVPYYEGFTGTVELSGSQIITKGKISPKGANGLEITELPIGYQNDKYKQVLNGLIEQGIIKDYDNLSTEEKWHFVINAPRNTVALSQDELLETFKLIRRSTPNFVLWGVDGGLKVYSDVNEVLVEFVRWRLGIFEEYRLAKIDKLSDSVSFMKEKVRFIEYWVKNAKSLVNVPKKTITETLLKQNFIEYHLDSFMRMSLWSLTDEEIQKAKDELSKSEEAKKVLESKTAKDLYREVF